MKDVWKREKPSEAPTLSSDHHHLTFNPNPAGRPSEDKRAERQIKIFFFLFVKLKSPNRRLKLLRLESLTCSFLPRFVDVKKVALLLVTCVKVRLTRKRSGVRRITQPRVARILPH